MTPDETTENIRIAIIFYSMTGNVLKLCEAAAEGVREVPGASAELRAVPELIPHDKINSNPRLKEVYEAKHGYEEAKPEDLREYDGFLFGTPTRYGNMSAQLREYFDRSGAIWQEGSTIGKYAGVITSTSTVHGGQETTAMTMWPTFIHLGMFPVGVPYSEARLFDNVPEGGSPYAASSISGPGSDQGPTERERAIARTLGRRVAEATLAHRIGCRIMHLAGEREIPRIEAFLTEGASTRGD